ncbi:MAG: hypothetical protein AAF721_29480 [Myxococcota bacterium]
MGAGVGLVALGLWLYDGTHEAGSAGGERGDEVAEPGQALTGRRAAIEASRVHPEVTPTVAGSGARAAAIEDRPASACATLDGEDCLFVEPDGETIDEMARCGIVRYEIPAFLDHLDEAASFEEAWLADAEVSPEEHEALAAAAEAFRSKTMSDIADLAVQVGLERSWAEQTPMLVAIGMIQSELDPEEHAEALATVARERAGLADPPSTTAGAPVAERAARLLAGTGDAFQDALASAVGPARAAELRKQQDGWPGVTRSIGNRCPVEPPLPVHARHEPRTPEEAQACIEDWQKEECRFGDPNPLLLGAMAKCGIVRFDFPTFMMTRDAEPAFEADWAEGTRLTPVEIATLAEVGEAVRAALYRDVTALALEVGKTPEWAASTPMMGLMMALGDEVDDRAEIEAVFRTIAQERAAGIGPSTPSPDAGVHERFIRRIVELGPTFEAAVGERLGAARAHQLREHADGWPSTRVQSASRC